MTPIPHPGRRSRDERPRLERKALTVDELVTRRDQARGRAIAAALDGKETIAQAHAKAALRFARQIADLRAGGNGSP